MLFLWPKIKNIIWAKLDKLSGMSDLHVFEDVTDVEDI